MPLVDPLALCKGPLPPSTQAEYLCSDKASSEGHTAHQNFTFIFIFQFQELGIKHPLHRKKLVLAVKAINTKQEEKSAQLDHIWVTRKDRHICIMFLTAPQSRQSFPVNMCLKDGCLLVKGGWISKPYGEYSWNSPPFGIHTLPFSRTLTHMFLPVSVGWLDDIGLPQYKDQFHESRVDGRMLQYLTVVRIFPFSILVVPVSTQLRYSYGGYFKLHSTTSKVLKLCHLLHKRFRVEKYEPLC